MLPSKYYQDKYLPLAAMKMQNYQCERIARNVFGVKGVFIVGVL